MVESKEELKSLLMKVKEESENVGPKLNIHIMETVPIISWKTVFSTDLGSGGWLWDDASALHLLCT